MPSFKMNQDLLPMIPEENLPDVCFEIYSSDEKKIGKWIDGKPLYQKTLVLAKSDVANGGFNYKHQISNIEKVIDCRGILLKDGTYNIVPWIAGIITDSTNWNFIINDIDATYIHMNMGAATYQRFANCWLTLKYTKK